MSDETYHTAKEDLRRIEHDESRKHPDGKIPANSQAAALQSIVDSRLEKNKSEIIEERKANLPLPEQPPAPSDWNSADQRSVNVGSGGVSDTFSHGTDALRDPAAADSAVRTDGDTYKTNVQGQGVGREGAEGLSGLPNDAVTREAKKKQGLEDTTNKDFGYPHKNDPADTSRLP